MAEKAHAAGKKTGGVGFLCIWLFCQIIRSFRNQPVKVALIGSVLQYPELFKLFLGKGFGNGGGHFALIMQNIFLVELQNASSRLTQSAIYMTFPRQACRSA